MIVEKLEFLLNVVRTTSQLRKSPQQLLFHEIKKK